MPIHKHSGFHNHLSSLYWTLDNTSHNTMTSLTHPMTGWPVWDNTSHDTVTSHDKVTSHDLVTSLVKRRLLTGQQRQHPVLARGPTALKSLNIPRPNMPVKKPESEQKQQEQSACPCFVFLPCCSDMSCSTTCRLTYRQNTQGFHRSRKTWPQISTC